ncbi:endo-beta-1,3-1,4 glucanase [Sorangium cellulosum]|uniref:Endo-beta-1,3-1,4 glucanase n=1 Tax=Sorangium cellulosum TaxID=56 RepID=A0A4V0NDU2_SORCE|nr:family 16 glycosylhydrolase [Sorangium cellulosum]AUX23862.1 endo-beta-1,3-1,4 glucanase [Sorangium cellulosum]
MFTRFRAGLMLTAASLALAVSSTAVAKPYKGAEVYTPQGYLHGRIEVRMRMARGSGILSTFFTYKDGSEQSGAFWEEIDIEVFGKDDARSWQSNIITGMGTRVTSEQEHTADVSLADGYHTYALEWTPDYVAWSFDGKEIRRSTGEQVGTLRNPQSLRFNTWSSDVTEWVGPFDDSVLPQHQFINWIKYYRYNNGAFELEWEDDFDSLDGARWGKADWTFDGNRVDFDPQNVTVKEGTLVLSLTREGQTGFTGAVPRDEDTGPGPGAGAGGAGTTATSSGSGVGGAGAAATTSGSGAGGADAAATSSGSGAGGADAAATSSGSGAGGADAAATSSGSGVGGTDTAATSSGSGVGAPGEGGGIGGTPPDEGSSGGGSGCVFAGASTTASSWAATLAVGLSAALAMRRRRRRR